jgi:hydrogenase nickel incorporation protein HypA/HybF
MHELSVTENILEISLRHAKSANANHIDVLFLKIGEYSSIVDESVQFYWDIITKGTIAEGSKLQFTRIPAEFLCLDCNQEYLPRDGQYICPNCNSKNIKLIKGNEFYLESIDVE